VHPRGVRLAGVGDRVEILEGAGVYLTGLRADDGWPARLGEHAGQELCTHPALVIDGHEPELLCADPQHAERTVDRDVPLLAGDDPERRATLQTPLADAPAGAVEDGVTRDGERGRVCHLAAGDECERRSLRKVEELLHPAPRRLLDDRRCGCRKQEARVLVPGGDEPVGSERRRQRPADHEAEVAPRAHRREAGLGVARKPLDDLELGSRLLGQRAAECLAELGDRRPRRDRPLRGGLDPLGRKLGRPREHSTLVVHEIESMDGRSRLRASAVRAVRASVTSQIGSGAGWRPDGIAQSTQPRLTSCSFQQSCVMFTAP
jgi:hypothetical protein